MEEQGEVLAKGWVKELGEKLKPEYEALKQSLRVEIDNRKQSQGELPSALEVLSDVGPHLNSITDKMQTGVNENLLNERLSQIEDPNIRSIVEKTGQYLLKVQRDTSVPFYFVKGVAALAVDEILTHK